MKEIVYLDTSYLHSFIAQIHGGLPSISSNENQESRKETIQDGITESETSEVSGDLSVLVAKLGTKIIPKTESSEGFSLEQLEIGKEIISKHLHDNALDVLYKHLEENDLFTDPNSVEINKYILIKKEFKIIDLQYLRSFMDKKFHKILGFTKGNKQQRSEFNPNEVANLFEFLSLILPSDFFIKQDNFISPLKKEFMREQSKELIFKYGDGAEIFLLGKVTNRFAISSSDLDPDIQDIQSINTLIANTAAYTLSQFNVLDLGDWIVSPIAIFFESE